MKHCPCSITGISLRRPGRYREHRHAVPGIWRESITVQPDPLPHFKRSCNTQGAAIHGGKVLYPHNGRTREHRSLEKWLDTAFSARAIDPRVVILALLAISDEIDQLIDYGKPTSEVFPSVVQLYIQRKDSLALLKMREYYKSSFNLPS